MLSVVKGFSKEVSRKLPFPGQDATLSDFSGEREERQATVFFSDGSNVVLTGADADRVINALEDFAQYPR